MDTNIKLEEEILFSSTTQKDKITQLHNLGVVTIKNFIDLDIDSVIKAPDINKEYKAYQRVIRTKYLKEPLLVSTLLDNEVLDVEGKSITGSVVHNYKGYKEILLELGFDLRFIIIAKSFPSTNENKKEKVINLIKKSMNKSENPKGDILAKFYVDYYEQGIDKVSTPVPLSEADELKKLKEQLLSLNNRQNEIENQRKALEIEENKIKTEIANVVARIGNLEKTDTNKNNKGIGRFRH